MSKVKKFDPCAVLGKESRMFDPEADGWFEFLVTGHLAVCAPGQFWFLERTFPHWVGDLERAGLKVLEWGLQEPARYYSNECPTALGKQGPRHNYAEAASFSVEAAVRGEFSTLDMSEEYGRGCAAQARKSLALAVLEKHLLPFDPRYIPFEANSEVIIFGDLPANRTFGDLSRKRLGEYVGDLGGKVLLLKGGDEYPHMPENYYRVTVTWPQTFSWISVDRLVMREGGVIQRWLERCKAWLSYERPRYTFGASREVDQE